MKKLLLLTLLLFAVLQAGAATWTDSNGIEWTFTVSGTNATSIKPSDKSNISGEIVIPGTVYYGSTALTVASIGYQAFQNCTGLTSVTIPSSVRGIGSYAFYGCSGLTSVIIPEGVTSIGDYAFYSCTGLTSVDIPEGVTSIGQNAFSGCSGLTSVTIPSSVTGISNKAFSGCSSLTSVTIGEGVTSIGQNAFSGCSSLTSVTIPSSVTGISDKAFSDCTGLTSVTIPSSVTSIGNNAFYGCSGLTSVKVTVTNMATFCNNQVMGKILSDIGKPVTLIDGEGNEITEYVIPEGVETIGANAFYRCTGLASVTIPSSVTSIGDDAFTNCSGLMNVTINSNAIMSQTSSSSNFGTIFGSQVKEYIIGEGVTSIGGQAFQNCTGLTSVTIPSSVTSIGGWAFQNCTGLTSVTIPSSVTSIGDWAFHNCSGLTSLTIPSSVTSIGDYAFYQCSGLTKVIAPDIAAWSSINFIGALANPLSYAKHLYSDDNTEIIDLVIPEGVTSIGDYAFYSCTGLTSVDIPEGVTSIGQNAFSGCSDLTSVDIPEGVTSIGNKAFYGCSGLTSVDIPSGVTSIGQNAFSGCSSLTSVTIGEGVTSIGQNAFSGCSSLTSVDIPEGVTSIAGDAFNGCSSLMCVTIPSSMTSIGENAFQNCSNLAKVIVPDIAAWCGISFRNYDANPLNKAHHIYRDVKTEITNLVIPEGVTSIGDYAFYSCYGLRSVTIPSSVTSIGDWAFHNCSGLTSVTIPEGVTSIGDYAFRSCSGLTSVTILDGVTSIGNYAFAYCSRLTSVNSPSSVASLTIPSSVTSIGDYAFYYCSGLASVTIPSNVTSIGNYAFSYCNDLQSVTFQEGVKSIGNNVFYHCPYDLVDVTFPSSLTSIGDNVFDWCYNVKSVNVSVPDLAAFCSNQVIGLIKSKIRLPVNLIDSDGNEIKEYVVPDGVKNIGASAFYNTNLTSVTIPSSVTSIDNSAFGSCKNLVLFKCYALDVPLTNANAFGVTDISKATLAVPYAVMSDYQTTSPWSNFGTITCLTIVVTANSYEREYGDPKPKFEWTVEGMPLNGTPSVTCTADESSAPGVYDIVIEQGTVTNANVTYVNGTLTITKAPLTITAKNYTINEGDAMPTFEVEYEGFKNDETESDLDLTAFTISCTASDTNTEGTYDIVVSGAASDNYDISYVAGKLTVVPTAAHITISSAGMATYCSPYDLDFTDVTGLKAYIITGYDRASTKVYAMRVFDVPAGTGLYLVGNAGNYDVPITSSNSYYINMLVGTLAQTRIEPTDGENTNLILAGTSPQNASFKPLSEGRNFGANKAYLQIPTSVLYNAANAVGIFFDDEVVDGIETVKHEMEQCDGDWYSIDGRKLDGKPTQKGIYIKNGKKAVFR